MTRFAVLIIACLILTPSASAFSEGFGDWLENAVSSMHDAYENIANKTSQWWYGDGEELTSNQQEARDALLSYKSSIDDIKDDMLKVVTTLKDKLVQNFHQGMDIIFNLLTTLGEKTSSAECIKTVTDELSSLKSNTFAQLKECETNAISDGNEFVKNMTNTISTEPETVANIVDFLSTCVKSVCAKSKVTDYISQLNNAISNLNEIHASAIAHFIRISANAQNCIGRLKDNIEERIAKLIKESC